jgi:hypothetical protein
VRPSAAEYLGNQDLPMSDETAAAESDDADRLIRMICFGGFFGLPVLIVFVHLLLIYRA